MAEGGDAPQHIQLKAGREGLVAPGWVKTNGTILG